MIYYEIEHMNEKTIKCNVCLHSNSIVNINECLLNVLRKLKVSDFVKNSRKNITNNLCIYASKKTNCMTNEMVDILVIPFFFVTN